ncbi:Hypothetical protein EPM1_1884 [Stenotrophomonas maltophilia EPM1]|nr:Hypothetical protein EPM1_1884 [Stenotrophomonas maltophilia EPM1]
MRDRSLVGADRWSAHPAGSQPFPCGKKPYPPTLRARVD